MKTQTMILGAGALVGGVLLASRLRAAPAVAPTTTRAPLLGTFDGRSATQWDVTPAGPAGPRANNPSAYVADGGDAQRIAGVSDLYAASGGQQAATDSAVAAYWDEMRNGIFKTDPYFWV